MKPILWIVAGVIVVLSTITLVFTSSQVREERATLAGDLENRTSLLSDSLKESIEPSYAAGSTESLQRIVNRFIDRERLKGIAVVDARGETVAASEDLPLGIDGDLLFVSRAMDADVARGELVRNSGGTLYVLASPLHQAQRVTGALVVVQSAEYIDEYVAGIWWDSLARLAVQIIFFSIMFAAIVRWIVIKPLARLAEATRQVRAGKESPGTVTEHSFFLQPIANEILKITKSLTQARFVASEEARMRLEKLDTPWTEQRLREFAKGYLKGKQIFVVSNREPYIHVKTNNKINCLVPAHGMVTAVESVMEACGGMWLAHGSGTADKETADESGKIAVPPEEPKYTLKRIWLNEKDVQGHYTGFSNEALFPLCHVSHVRPMFRKEDWSAYKRVNGKFAAAILAEIKDIPDPIILVQDLHFALLPQMIKKSRPDARVGIFWHHPWPSAEQFNICPWRKEILEGLISADVIGFHIQQYSNNFIDTVGKEVESLIDRERFVIMHGDHESSVRVLPISIAFTNGSKEVPDKALGKSVLEGLGIRTEYVGLGVERLDYIKGIIEHLKGVETFLDKYPQYLERFTFLQIAAPSRESVQKYREYGASVDREVERINKKFQKNGWRPIVYERRMYSHAELLPVYSVVNFCAVTSLHDGMNLVSKEFVATRNDEAGSLILSQFTGAARQLGKGALMVNPYDIEEIAEAILKALNMSSTEQRRRMQAMRNTTKDYNVYRWAAEFLKAVVEK